eukprot:TRINITY_DN390_c0_g2_i1.p1 TRINITY_DN390_c0_g2~~TRINITY_DN390_c0_g2_i1.p1  ORF type:complete len:382 (+),score=154.82 TRINITY_DN390_c0_g2_i1:502-1647(+)
MSDLKSGFVALTKLPYADQAKWFLNGFWLEGLDSQAEDVWDFAHKFIKLDDGKKDGHELDEFKAHRFLESLGETLTVVKMREKLKQIDLDVNGRMALIEYLLFKYNKGVEATVNAPQGDNREELAEAEAKVAAVQEALDQVQRQLAEQKEALAAQKAAEADAKQRQKESDAAAQAAKASEDEAMKARAVAQEAESQALAAEADVKAAVDDLKAQETAYSNKISELDGKSKDTSTGQVARSKAAAELAQLKQENPLPLRKAKITQEAALRVLEKKRKEAEATANEARSRADAAASSARQAEAALRASQAAAAEAEAKRLETEESTRRVEQAVRETEEAYDEAVRYFEEVKKKPGTPFGAIWWMQRELKEAQKYMPKRKQTAL